MSKSKPKVLLFDIGGVCVVSPFQAILDYELSLGIPPGWVNYSISRTAPNGFWHRLEKGEIEMNEEFFRGFSQDLHDPVRWETFYKREQDRSPSLPKETPPVPSIDAEWLFNEMMTVSNEADPWMFPALRKLKEDGRFILAALSNTVIFPPGHKLHQDHFFDEPVRQIFDVFISSAHVGIRKPDPAIYKLALDRVNEFAKANAHSARGGSLSWEVGIKAEEVMFLDDIGENLKEARRQGVQTIKVNLGRAFEAVDELERVTGLKLAGDHPRISVEGKVQKVKAKM
ncbi:microsomal epoxide hydrolase [Fusarium sp. NRRL 25303]|nr:microsomal epoxide hydrolase [Fusarium sp. NRRL 25303]